MGPGESGNDDAWAPPDALDARPYDVPTSSCSPLAAQASSPSRTGLSLWKACKLLRWSPSVSPCDPAHPTIAYSVPTSPADTHLNLFRSICPCLIRRVRASLGPDACAPELPKRLDHRPSGSSSLRARRATAVPRRDPSLSCVLKSSADAASRSRRGLSDRPRSAVPATGRHAHPSIHTATSTIPLYLLPCPSCPNSGQTAHISHTSCTVDFLFPDRGCAAKRPLPPCGPVNLCQVCFFIAVAAVSPSRRLCGERGVHRVEL